MYAPTPHGIFDAQGGILPEVRRARRRGILFDFGNGRTEHWKWETAESGLRQGFPPDTISSDLDLPGRSEGVLDLPNVLSKFLLLGMPLTQVIACATRNAARAIRPSARSAPALQPTSPCSTWLKGASISWTTTRTGAWARKS
jgi:dihydroorotase